MREPKRTVPENAYFHVTTRGNQKQRVFLQDQDYEKYLDLLRHYKRKFHCKIYAWCLMPTHVHLVLQVNKPMELAKIMQGQSLAYAKWFNKKYTKVGHLWQGRFKSKVMQDETYVVDCINYIEMNPVRASMVKSPMDYPWSSYRYRVLGIEMPLLDQLVL